MRDPDKGADESGTRFRVGRLKRRADFVRAGKGRRWHGEAVSLQSRQRTDDPPRGDEPPVRVGFTLTRKVGCAVIRNRARRRLKEAVRLGSGLAWQPGHDYVIIGRIEAIRLSFEDLTRELDCALRGARRLRGAAPSTRPERTRPSP